MVGRELKRFGVYGLFLAILIFPMVGFRGPMFDASRALRILGILLAILLFGFLYRALSHTPGFRTARSTLLAPARGFSQRLSRVPRPISLGLAALALVVYPLSVNNYMIDVAITVLIYVCLGLGLNVVVGLAGLLDLGYVAFYAVGAYTYSLLNLHYGIPFWFAIPLGMVIGVLCGCVIGYPTLRMRGDYLAIVTLGFGEIIRIVLNNWDKLTEGPNGLLGMQKPTLIYPSIVEGKLAMATWTLNSLPSLYYTILVIAVLTLIAVQRLDDSRIGRAWVAIREDETAAELTGIPTILLKLLAYAMGSVFASVAGAFFAAKLSYTNPNFFVFMESCVVLCIVVLGGMGSIPGIIVGALALIAIPEVFRDLQNYRMLAFGAAMTVIMVLKPEGLFPASRRKRELHEADGAGDGGEVHG